MKKNLHPRFQLGIAFNEHAGDMCAQRHHLIGHECVTDQPPECPSGMVTWVRLGIVYDDGIARSAALECAPYQRRPDMRHQNYNPLDAMADHSPTKLPSN